MYFKSINLENFRNYKNLYLEFDKKLNIITGENAQGKTNIIESLYIMGLGKSFRTNKDQDMIAFGSTFSKASSIVIDEDKETSIDVILQNEGKILKVDGIKLNKTADILENVYVVVFCPDDLRIVKDGPENRRRFIDREICQIKPIYYSDLGNYKKVLKQRNYLLKNKCTDYKLIEVFDESLANYGIRIAKERYNFINNLSLISNKIHSDISGNKEKLDISYDSKILSNFNIEEYKEKLKNDFKIDQIKGFTNFGPHKDDLCLKINDIDIRNFGSQGQQRTAALSLKLAEINLIKQETGKDAILLLDDVLSELDLSRQKFLIDYSMDVQMFITATSIDENLKSMLLGGKSFIVDNAKVDIYNN